MSGSVAVTTEPVQLYMAKSVMHTFLFLKFLFLVPCRKSNENAVQLNFPGRRGITILVGTIAALVLSWVHCKIDVQYLTSLEKTILCSCREPWTAGYLILDCPGLYIAAPGALYPKIFYLSYRPGCSTRHGIAVLLKFSKRPGHHRETAMQQ